jgi:hypothetical protein
VQAGYLRGMRDMKRGLVLDVTPVATMRTTGLPNAAGDDWRYGVDEQFGADVRWGVTSNFTLNATGIGISIGAGRLSVAYRARSPTAYAPTGGRRRAH